ncbi:MAG: geranylgeranyl pyrophosphate synthase protein [Bryobacterales bacterium]|nr:geranylgeranyl pyrophosphate synthase protein [Bryobacterales bacterium]
MLVCSRSRPGARALSIDAGPSHFKMAYIFPKHSSDYVWGRARQVFENAEEFAFSQAVGESQRALMAAALGGFRARVDDQSRDKEDDPPALPPMLSLFAYGGIRGNDEAAIPLAGATTLVYIGIDVFDDVGDGDHPGYWGQYGAAEMNLAAATLLSSLSRLAVLELDIAPPIRTAIERSLGKGLLAMSAGQQYDLATADSSVCTVDEVEASVCGKSGKELAMFARVGAELAEASPDIVDSYERFGYFLGAASQLSSDCYDLYQDPESRDLAHGARTLPIAFHLERLAQADRQSFLSLLDQARHDEHARCAVRERVREAGDLRRCAFLVETYCQRALRALEKADPLQPAHGILLAMIDSVSFFPKRRAFCNQP